MTNASRLIALLNSLTLGDLDAIRSKLDEARAECASLGFDEVGAIVADARGALVGGDVKTYRKRVETAIARLGHLR